MKETTLHKIYNHIDREQIIGKLSSGVSADEVNRWLKSKYSINNTKLVFSTKILQQFKDEYLDLVKQIQNDCIIVRQQENAIVQDMQTTVQNNSIYRQKLEEYLDKEIDIKAIVKNMVLAIEMRAMQVFDDIQQNPTNTKKDYVLIQWFNSLTAILERYDTIINGSSDKIIQQNNINIQILDQHIGVFHKVIREVISRLDYDTSLLFIDIMNEELQKLKPTAIDAILPIDMRLAEAQKLEGRVLGQLDIPSI